MENITLSDSNDDLVEEIIENNDSSQVQLRTFTEQHVTSELQDAANTFVTKAPFTTSPNTPFKPLFSTATNSTPISSNDSPLLFQLGKTNIAAVNPFVQQSASQMQSPLIQPPVRPPNVSSLFQSPSAFTPLHPASTPHQHSSTIQPKSMIENQQTVTTSVIPAVPFPNVATQSTEIKTFTTPIMTSPLAQDKQKVSHDLSLGPPLPPPSMTIRDPNSKMLSPPQQAGTPQQVNPYSARASLTERIYPSMPMSNAPSQQMPPPFPTQSQNVPQPTGSIFVPSSFTSGSTTVADTDTSGYAPTYQAPDQTIAPPLTDPLSSTYNQQQYDVSSANSSGIWGWLSNNKMFASVVEKAKTGLETVITTVDPQMKQYIQPGHEVNIVVTSAKDVKLTPVRDAFTQVFGRAIVQGIGVQSNVAPQPIGFEAGFKGAQQRIENLRRQNVVRPDQCIVSIENFIAELVPDMYFDLGYVLLSDPSTSIELHLFTQAVPVPIEYVYQARDRTPADYPLKWSGYMVTVGEILHSQLPMINPEDWHEFIGGASRRDIIFAACKSLAYMYKQRLDRKQ